MENDSTAMVEAASVPDSGHEARVDAGRRDPLYRRLGAPVDRVRGLFRFRLDGLSPTHVQEAVQRAISRVKLPDIAATLRSLKPALIRLAPFVLVFLAIRGASWVGTKQREAWLRGQTWPPEALGVFLFGVRPRRH